MATDNEVIHQCLEAVANSHTDIAPAVYASISEKMPGMDQHIGFMDSRMRGRMLDQIYKLLLGDVDKGYLEFEARMHPHESPPNNCTPPPYCNPSMMRQ